LNIHLKHRPNNGLWFKRQQKGERMEWPDIKKQAIEDLKLKQKKNG
jgi:hypothetical protein